MLVGEVEDSISELDPPYVAFVKVSATTVKILTGIEADSVVLEKFYIKDLLLKCEYSGCSFDDYIDFVENGPDDDDDDDDDFRFLQMKDD